MIGLAFLGAAWMQSPPEAVPLPGAPTNSGDGWHVVTPGRSIVYGVPGSDAFSVRIDCRSRRLEVTVRYGASDDPEAEAVAVFDESDGRTGNIVERDEGTFLTVPLDPDDPLLDRLAAQELIRLEAPGAYVSVPGEGLAPLLHSLRARCRR